ncbi:MAG TPA: alpha/beta hydrolase [Candidatus Dormibacteraeota bacterium]|nr:alpha/beta hydrolase [Candidatus Dormibacteraeota bacterium]
MLPIVVAEQPPAHLQVSGQGSDLLLLHGWGTSSQLFDAVVPQLQDGRRIVAPDLPGFGETPAPSEPWDVAAYATWTLALLDRLGVQRCDVVGHSNGGRIAIMLAARHPERVRKVVLTGSAGIRPRRGLRSRWNVRTYKMLRRASHSKVVPAALRSAAAHRADRRGSEDYRTASGVMRGTLVRIVNQDLRTLLPQITAPVLLIWGDADTETPLRDARLMERLIPDSGLVVFEGAGHYAYLEQAGRFAHIVDVFLRDPRGVAA